MYGLDTRIQLLAHRHCAASGQSSTPSGDEESLIYLRGLIENRIPSVSLDFHSGDELVAFKKSHQSRMESLATYLRDEGINKKSSPEWLELKKLDFFLSNPERYWADYG